MFQSKRMREIENVRVNRVLGLTITALPGLLTGLREGGSVRMYGK